MGMEALARGRAQPAMSMDGEVCPVMRDEPGALGVLKQI